MRSKQAQQKHDRKVATHNRKRKLERKLQRIMEPLAWAYRKLQARKKQANQGQ